VAELVLKVPLNPDKKPTYRIEWLRRSGSEGSDKSAVVAVAVKNQLKFGDIAATSAAAVAAAYNDELDVVDDDDDDDDVTGQDNGAGQTATARHTAGDGANVNEVGREDRQTRDEGTTSFPL